MTKRDYELIAACIRTQLYVEMECNNSETGVAVMSEFARRIGSELLNTNPRFNLTKFLAATGTCDIWTREAE